jgi:uncharacterized membrane protein
MTGGEKMGCLFLVLLVLIVLPILILTALNIITISYSELGVSQNTAFALLCATLIGSMINIPISKTKIEYQADENILSRIFYYHAPPRVAAQTIAVNVGGAIIPTCFSIYLMRYSPLVPTLLATLAVILVARLFSRVVPGAGITMPTFVTPLVSAGLALLLARSHPAPVAFISGTLGTLIGADLLHWPDFKKLGPAMISIGGAGVFDGVFLSGILAVAISTL